MANGDLPAMTHRLTRTVVRYRNPLRWCALVLVAVATGCVYGGWPRSARAQQSACVGDCDHDGMVTVTELILGVNIALDRTVLTACPSFDRDGDGRVTIPELIAAVVDALNDCPTATGTPTPTATRGSPTATVTVGIIDFGLAAFVANDGSGTISVLNGTAPRARGTFALQFLRRTQRRPIDRLSQKSGPLFTFRESAGSGGLFAIDLAAGTADVEVGGLPRAMAISPDGRLLYVTSQFPDVLSVIDSSNGVLRASIPVGLSPEGVALTADGGRAYVTNFASDNVSVIDTATNRVVATIPVAAAPNAVAVTPDGAQVYVTHLNRNSDNSPAEGTVSVIDAASNRVKQIILLGTDSEFPVAVVITADGRRAFVTSFFRGLISAIDTNQNVVAAQGELESLSRDFSNVSAAAADLAGHLYVTDFSDDTVKILDPALFEPQNRQTGRVRMSPATSLITTIPVRTTFPAALSVTAQADRIFVGSFALPAQCTECPVGTGTLSVIDTASATVMASVGVDRFPVSIALAPVAPTAQPQAHRPDPLLAAPLPTPTLNCYTVDCVDPNDCLIPIGRHQPKFGGLRSGEGEHMCAGDRVKLIPTP